jgi:hypothetical protein
MCDFRCIATKLNTAFDFWKESNIKYKQNKTLLFGVENQQQIVIWF